MLHPEQARRRWRAAGLACGLVLGLTGMLGQAIAGDGDRALAELRPAPPTAPRGSPVLRQAWADQLRLAERMVPPLPRPVDQALLQAARDGRWPDVLQLLKTGQDSVPANPDASDAQQGSVLVLAAQAGADAVARELLQRGADPQRIGETGFTALGAAAFHGHQSMLRLLLRAGADPLRWGATGQGALHLAALAGQVGALDTLLRAGLPVDQLNSQRETALDVAAASNQAEAMDLLIRGGADLPMAGRR